MGRPILVRGSDSRWREPEVTSYENEAALQQLVAESPDLLTGQDLATVDEFWIPDIGYVDIVGVGADGAITVVECKLREGLRDIPAIAPHGAHVTSEALNRFPSIPVAGVLDQEPVRQAFLRVIDEVRLSPRLSLG